LADSLSMAQLDEDDRPAAMGPHAPQPPANPVLPNRPTLQEQLEAHCGALKPVSERVLPPKPKDSLFATIKGRRRQVTDSDPTLTASSDQLWA
jgi:hypothetical protein